MDVKYIPSDWENVKKGIGNLIGLGAWGKGMIDSLKDISDNLEDAQANITKYDVDGAISFSHTGHKGVYQGLYEDFKVLHDFAGKVGDIVDRTIDEPFYKDIDAFVSAMEGLSIAGIKTKNRIGAKETVVIPGEYGSNTMEVPKAEVTLEDLFSGSNAYAKQMKEEYDNWKLQNPDQELSEKNYEQAVLHSRAFQYDSIRDGQEKKEFWGQIASLAVVVGTSIICPPAALALGIAYGTLELESAITGKDWISGRELGTGERVFRGVLAPLDIVPGVSGLSKFSSTVRLAHMGDMAELGLKTGLKAGTQRESRHVAKMVIDAGKDSAARIRSAKAWAKEVPGKVKQKVADDIIDTARLMDSTYTFAKNILPSRQMGLLAEEVGSIRAPAENTHTMENGVRALFSRADEVNVESGPGNKGTGNVLGDGTVWDNIKITQPLYEGTKIPKSFELVADGKKFWVHPNGTKHMVEYITRDATIHGMPINSQTLLSSFQSSVKDAVKEGIKYEEIMNIGNWELIFSKPRGDGLLPVIKHAVYRP
ncbi:pre-toxin TG domain-containing protein [Caldifermentibacillus hisashii]|uniref:Pre-toxin TG domain-containing protein n=1 Tax=Caldifermentibacillus hisashii TaxID=996558 RepID=A0ABU9K2B9_9BACI